MFKIAFKDLVVAVLWGIGLGFMLVALLSAGCDIPTAEQIDMSVDEALAKIEEVKAECKVQADSATALCTMKADEASALCTMKADEAAQLCEDTINDVIDEVQVWFEERIAAAEADVMTRAGCFRDTSSFGWNCTLSPVCGWLP